MQMTLYYLCHTVKNQIRKLCRTWVAVFILVCFLFGVGIGLGAAALSSLFEEVPEDEAVVEVLPDETVEEVLLPVSGNDMAELVIGGIVAVVLLIGCFAADKSGGSIFLMADVNLLFPAPLRPQSVLLFRLIMQAGTSILATLYLLFQIPSLVGEMGLSFAVALAGMAAWFFLIVYSKLLSVMLYTAATTHPALKRRVRMLLYGVIGAILVSYLAYMQSAGGDYLTAASGFFNGPVSRYIPIWGWLKGLVMFTVEGNVMGAVLSFVGLLLLVPLLAFGIWHIKADFYEDAMARSEKNAEVMQAAEAGKPVVRQRKKDRKDTLRRDGLCRGEGATVYFHKTLYNRFRFAHFCVLTKTSETYLLLTLLIVALQLFATHSSNFAVVGLTIGGFAFFRSLGNPVAEDVERESFLLVPDSMHKKVLCSFAGGLLNSFLDMLPAFLVGAVLLRADFGEVLLWLLVVLTVGAYSDGMGMFIDLSLSTGLSQTVRSLVQVMFVYFGLVPTAVLMAVGLGLDRLLLFSVLAVLWHLLVVAASLTVSPLFLQRGRR